MENIMKPAHIANVDFDVPCTLSLRRGSMTAITSDNIMAFSQCRLWACPARYVSHQTHADADRTEWLSGFLRAQLSQAHKLNRHD
ncbi:hypothetical protein HFO04_34880 [Rhizobium laguerreae]|uniref:hypothetical protein n=1 Tax=Rhizobium laguerreae TaxID=1076926 RepID=UPI001C901EDC|nr:hypothetical protein [Rhizobium laguerreae]MBY3307892.1 hypothetical protein [Rhizobium laguerreae]